MTGPSVGIQRSDLASTAQKAEGRPAGDLPNQTPDSVLLLFRRNRRRGICRLRNRLRHSRCWRRLGLNFLIRKVIAVPEILVESAGQLGSAGTEGGPSAFQKENGHQAALR